MESSNRHDGEEDKELLKQILLQMGALTTTVGTMQAEIEGLKKSKAIDDGAGENEGIDSTAEGSETF